MAEDESAETRQDNEFEALKAIYPENVKDNRKKAAWNRWVPLDLTLSLTPLQGSLEEGEDHGVHVSLDLHLICSETYPNTAIKKILLENNKGLSDNALIELQECLEKKAAELEGLEAIYELAQCVKEFLHSHNKPAKGSLHEEMLERKKKEEEIELLAKNLKEEETRKEIQQREEILKSEARGFREQRHSSETDDFGMRTLSSSNSQDDSGCSLCGHKNTVFIEFSNRKIQRGQCLRHCSLNHTVFIAIDVKTGEVVILSEWIIENSTLLGNLDQDFINLIKFRHPNLVHFLDLKCEHQSNGNVVVYITKEFVNGPNCTYFINENFELSIQFIKYISKGVLNALDYLHRNNIIHKDIQDGCVYINDKGVVLLSNYALHRRLGDLCSSSTNTSTKNYNKKTDILNFGILLLSLFQGEKIQSDELEIPSTIPADLRDFLSKCLMKQDKRSTASQLLSHPFICQTVPLPSPKHRSDPNILDRNISPDVTSIIQRQPSTQQRPSRIKHDFEILNNLGKGGFGDVLKARNILDGGYYAIKCIKLNPKNRNLNRKICREVTLLSRLNHENIVRYYNSWIESTEVHDDFDESNSSSSNESDQVPKIRRQNELTINDNIEELAPSIKSFETTSITYDSLSKPDYDSAKDDSSDDEDSWGKTVEEEASSDGGIEFKRDDDESSAVEESTISTNKSPQSKASSLERLPNVRLYIQMEFCETGTLRMAIDQKIYLNEQRVLRLFREMVEGLSYIHQQGMIHRDLKPVNIFLDASDRVKIGDFGLATSMNSRRNEYNLYTTSQTDKEDTMDESKTGRIGTALYVAPELGLKMKANYNQKVDIYSLGIIFFEMSYEPLNTGMERIKLLTGLRKKEINFPKGFANKENRRKTALIRWLLNHDPTKRPTSQEILQSEYVPPPIVEECQLRDLVQQTLSNTKLTNYKFLIASCFNQKLPAALDITYDRESSANKCLLSLERYEYVKEHIINIFKRHGGHNLHTSLLLPKSQYYETTESYVKLMTHSGGIVSLPHDLRVPFARYVAWNDCTFMRRYSIERVYREKRVFGFSPRELYECAFDIVTPQSGNLLADAELLYIGFEIINELPAFKNKPITIKLNHTLLLQAISLHFGIKDKDKQEDTLRKILKAKDGKLTSQNALSDLGLPDSVIATLSHILCYEDKINRANRILDPITKKGTDASDLVKKALEDLEAIIEGAKSFGVTCNIILAPAVIHNMNQFSGVIFEFVCESKKKQHMTRRGDVLAAGGRYDAMIRSYRQIMDSSGISKKNIQQSAVGISLSLDRLVQATSTEEEADLLPNVDSVDVVITVNSAGTNVTVREQTKLLRELWSVGIRPMLIELPPGGDIFEQCAKLNNPHIIILNENDQGVVSARIWEKVQSKYSVKEFKTDEIVENLKKYVKPRTTSQDFTSFVATTPKESRLTPRVNILPVSTTKLTPKARQRGEQLVYKYLDYLLQQLNGDVTVVAVFGVEGEFIRTIAANLVWENEDKFKTSQTSIERLHRDKSEIIGMTCKQIFELKWKKSKQAIIILFSTEDTFHRLIL